VNRIPVPGRLDEIAIHPAPPLAAPNGGAVRPVWPSRSPGRSFFALGVSVADGPQAGL